MNKNLDIVWTNQFKKDYKLAMKRSLNIDLLDDIIHRNAQRSVRKKGKGHSVLPSVFSFFAGNKKALDIFREKTASAC